MNNFCQTKDQSTVVLLEIFIYILPILIQSKLFQLIQGIEGNCAGIKWSLFCQIWLLWSDDMTFFAERGRIFLLFLYLSVFDTYLNI